MKRPALHLFAAALAAAFVVALGAIPALARATAAPSNDAQQSVAACEAEPVLD